MDKKKIKTILAGHSEIPYALFIIVTILPLLIRVISNHPIIPMDVSYIHIQNSLRGIEFNIYDMLLNIIPPALKNLLPFILGIASLILLRTILFKLYRNRFLINVTSILFSLTPFTIFMFTTHNSYSGAFFLLTASIALFLYSKNRLLIIFVAGLLTSMIALIYIELFFAALLFLLLILINHDKKNISALLISSIVFFIFQASIPGSASRILFHNTSLLIDILIPYHTTLFKAFYDLGGIFSFSILYLFLAFIFIFSSLNISKKLVDKRIFIVLLVLSFFYISVRLFFIIPLSIYSAKGLVILFKKKWNVKAVMGWTFLLILCLFIFQYGTQLSYLSRAEPTQNMVKSLEFIKDNPRADNILTDPTIASIAEYYSGKKTLYKETFVPGVMKEESFDDITPAQTAFFRSNDWSGIKRTLNQTDARYILVTDEMIQGKIWEKEEGLLFLLRNSDVFVNTYRSGDVSLWLFIG